MNSYKIFIIFASLTLIIAQVPDQFGWDNVNGTSFVPDVHSQNYPQPCRSGWAFSTVDVFNSRMKILRKAASPDL